MESKGGAVVRALSSHQFKVDRLQIILVAKKYISTCRNCSSVGCLKCVQFHHWFRLHVVRPGFERMPYASWFFCWFFPRGSHRVLRFSPLLKNQHFQIPIPSKKSRTRFDQSTPWVNKLQIVLIYEEVVKRKKRKKIFKQIYIFCFIPLFTFWSPWRLIIFCKLP